MRLFLYTSRLKRSGEGWTRMAGDKGGKERDREREREREARGSLSLKDGIAFIYSFPCSSSSIKRFVDTVNQPNSNTENKTVRITSLSA
jgi:hypothetical protein